MQHHFDERPPGATQEIPPDPSRSNLVQKYPEIRFNGNDTLTGYRMFEGSGTMTGVANGTSLPRSQEAFSTGYWPPHGASLSVELGYSRDPVPISPSVPFSQMGLNAQPSPIIPNLNLEAVDEGDECAITEEEGDMFSVSGGRESMGYIFGIDIDLASEGGFTAPITAPEPFSGFDLSSPMGKAAEDTKHSSPPSPGIEFYIKRRNTEGAGIDKAIWSPSSISDFPNYNVFLGVPSSSTEFDHPDYFPPMSSSCPTRSGAASPTRPQISSTGSETGNSLCRKNSKRLRSQSRPPTRCNKCISPDRPTKTQKLFLHELPTELLLLIFEFAYLSPTKFPKCGHKQKSSISNGSGMTRRVTVGSISSSLNDDPPNLPDGLRIYRAKTLLYIALTCHRFNDILLDPFIDNTFWRSAARWCWNWLPGYLADVQGRELAHQTSWRNLVGVFMRSENGLFRQKGGGRGGVECFGGNKGCTPAILWKDEKAKKFLQGKKVEGKKLLMVCAQPGPDLFHVSRGENGQFIISLSLRGGAEYFITLDEYGQFGKRPARLPGGLKRSERSVGYFPPDIFEVEGDRFQLVKVWKGRDRSTAVPSQTSSKVKSHPKPAVKEIVTWDLHCVQEFESDLNATVARCINRDGILVFNLFTDSDDSNAEFLLEPPLDPPEDQRLFCVQAFGCPGSRKTDSDRFSSEVMSERRSGGMRTVDTMDVDHDTNEPTTVFRWRREFEYERASDFEAARHLHYVICNMKLNSEKAVVLIRWNVRTQSSNEELVDRQFQILDLKTGNTIQVLQFPNLYWDHRHHDMSVEYNEMRHKKMSRLFNHMGPDELMGAGNRCTRIHEDSFILTEDKIVSGSHDYCNWVWDLNAKPVTNEKCVFDAKRNDAGVADPFKVLDDFYWDEGQANEMSTKSASWNTRNERAGWWVRTPNQVMCFWHGISGSTDGRYFATCRPGKMFVWDLEAERNTIIGFQNCPGGTDSKNNRWLGRLATHAENLRHRLRNWFIWEDVLPQQGLWLLFDDFEAVYLDRDDILHACGLNNGKRTWPFQSNDFTFDDSDEEGNRGQKQREDSASASDGDDNEYESEEDGGFSGPKRRRTNSFRANSFRTAEFLGGGEPFRFSNESDMD